MPYFFNIMHHRTFAFVCLAIALLATGCGDSLPATVTGTITLDGELLRESENIAGNVMFYPVAGGAAAFGDVTAGGVYRVTTGSTAGIEPGEYLVTARVIEIEPPPPGGYQDAPPQKLISPARYNDKSTTDLRVQVEPGANKIDLPLLSSS